MKKFVKMICIILSALLLLSAFGCSSSDRDVATCSACGKKYYAGDAGGNYMSIAYSSMCKSCNREYKNRQEMKDYLELNS